jgi:hypothetical protein
MKGEDEKTAKRPKGGLYDDFAKVILADGAEGAIARLVAGTDREFQKLHPELKGERLSRSSPVHLQQEWRDLYLAHSRAAMSQLALDASIIAGLA